ncbi:FMN-dependent NADH-azoreductase [Rhizosphaericola mali]|uniref:FMN dependent NADH:quinone oxidoreductase n=1 Tax=Rhizosphaericola mali TaxID=2545455 RepID=A0A5P2GBI4_9BACT|nr:NAD(P)H-dependent oxidoreductase [Rhizosphaericola mali]QES90573.1 FMN-dependent NADH-azoreductase [Rhizosphaericola mali]
MKKVLEVIASARGAESFSTKLADHIVSKISEKYDGSSVIKKDIVDSKIPHLNPDILAAFFTPLENQADSIKGLDAFSNKAIKELQEADTIVIAVPFYNFGIPSVLKAYIDHVAVGGKTFKYIDGAPVGLLTGKKVYLAISSGGVYSEGDYKAYDFTEPYLRTVLGFLGMTDVTTFRIEGLNVSALKDRAVEKGLNSVVID